MKNIISPINIKSYIISLLLCLFSIKTSAQSISPSAINSIGTSFQTSYAGMDINIGEPITGIITNGSNQITQGFLQPNISTMNLKAYLQGYYSANGLMDNSSRGGCLYILGISPNFSDVDTVRLSLVNPSSHTVEETSTGIIQTDGTVSIDFKTAPEGYYYLKINHRNSFETWSALPIPISVVNTYDFTTAITKAYDDGFFLPMKLVDTSPERWAILSGDIDRDGAVTSLDMTLEENRGNSNSNFGYYVEDLNGDGFSNDFDMNIIEDNANVGAFFARP